jgi:hypothetical protein
VIDMGTASLALMNNLERIPIPVEDIRCGGLFWNSGVRWPARRLMIELAMMS